MKTREDVSHYVAEKVPVTFQDIAACFSEEEWKLLHDWQKELYENVMKEINQALMSLGDPILDYDNVLRIEQELVSNLKEHHNADVGESIHSPSSGVEPIFPIVSFNIKEEDDSTFTAKHNCETRGSINNSEGTNWTQHILYDMVYTISNQEPPGEIPMLEFGTPQKLERLSNLPSPRVLITHLHRDYLPEQVFTKKLKTLVVFRNPKDNAVSLFHFHLGNPLLPKYNSWDEFFTVFMSGEVNFGSYFDHAIAWNKHIEDENVLIIMFEDMKKDLIAAISQIADFFSIHLTKEQIELIATNGSFKTMKEKSTETHGPMGKFIFRKGEVGDWKNYFSEAQSLEMDAKFEACLAGTKIGEKMKYNVYCKA